jgi:hypothetical protein
MGKKGMRIIKKWRKGKTSIRRKKGMRKLRTRKGENETEADEENFLSGGGGWGRG